MLLKVMSVYTSILLAGRGVARGVGAGGQLPPLFSRNTQKNIHPYDVL